MKKILISFITALLCLNAAKACDICGCGAGNSYIGILPDFYKHIFGVRYRYNSLYTHIGADGASTYLTSNERYHTTELWTGWKIANKFTLMINVPFNFDERINQGTSKSKNGIGDISVAGYYQLLNKQNAVLKDKLLEQSLWIGGSIKLPTGEYNPADKANTNENANLFQLGTGSVDYSLAAMYDIRLQNTGINVSAAYKINTANKYDYKYGDKLSLTTQVYHKMKAGNFMLAPNAGVQYENGEKDSDKGFSIDLSGGRLLLATIGTEISFKKIAVGANWQTPLSQNLASGFIKANNRMMIHVAFAL